MATEETKPASGGGGSKILPIMLGLNSLLIAGVLVMLVLKPGGMKGAPAAEHGAAEKPAEGHGSEKKAEGEKKPEEHGAEKKEGEKSEHGSSEGHGSPEGHAAAAVPAPAGSPTLKLPDFTVRLRNPEADRYARITFEVQVAGESDKSAVETHLPQVRDAFLSYLSDRTMEELRGSEGIEKTKQALLDRMPRAAPGAKVLAIYVTDMVVQ